MPSIGIIPARAGFTLPTATPTSPQQDHPRSRGVYRAQAQCDPNRKGSSPLARGLQADLVFNFQHWGIIPARAGFTGVLCCLWSELRDHPRSRGVYPLPCRPLPRLLGSSPLARGLLMVSLSMLLSAWIIPARAGFTHGVSGSSGKGRGSSPLARGLPIKQRHRILLTRIIPARAGFTFTVVVEVSDDEDHPRSRGVYH